MSVLLNEAALHFLLEDESGPVGRDVRRRAENIARIAEVNASGTLIGIESGDLHSGIRFEVENDDRGLFATVGTDAEHGGFAYPTYWDQNGKPWLSQALQDGFDS